MLALLIAFLTGCVFAGDPEPPLRIAVAGHDCKGCNFGLYRAVASLDGVERAVASFKEGQVTAWIDPGKTNRQTLVDELRKRDVTLLEELPAK